MRDRINVLWKHYSSWLLYAIIAVGAIPKEEAMTLGLSPRLVSILAVCALVAKLIPQKTKTEVLSANPYGDSVMDSLK